jgi:hypothetical protein
MIVYNIRIHVCLMIVRDGRNPLVGSGRTVFSSKADAK